MVYENSVSLKKLFLKLKFVIIGLEYFNLYIIEIYLFLKQHNKSFKFMNYWPYDLLKVLAKNDLKMKVYEIL